MSWQWERFGVNCLEGCLYKTIRKTNNNNNNDNRARMSRLDKMVLSSIYQRDFLLLSFLFFILVLHVILVLVFLHFVLRFIILFEWAGGVFRWDFPGLNPQKNPSQIPKAECFYWLRPCMSPFAYRVFELNLLGKEPCFVVLEEDRRKMLRFCENSSVLNSRW